MRNLARLTNAANNIEAGNDWQKQVSRAWAMEQQGKIDPILRRYKITDTSHTPWRKLDKATAALRTALDALAERQAVLP